jgi:hypothetical protein
MMKSLSPGAVEKGNRASGLGCQAGDGSERIEKVNGLVQKSKSGHKNAQK